MGKLLIILYFSISIVHAQMNQSKYATYQGFKKILLPHILIKNGLKKIGHKKKYKQYFNKNTQTEQNRCSRICPKNFNILKSQKLNILDNNIDPNERFNFLNEKEDFINITPRTYGYCWGYASLNRKMQYLANFSESLSDSDEIKINKIGKEKLYTEIIKKIIKDKFQTIPGYKNINEFSSDPIIKDLLKRAIVKEWSNKAISITGLSILMKKRYQSIEKLDVLIKRLKEKIETNQTPIIYFTHDELSKYIHVVPVYQLRESDEETKLCFMDNHDKMIHHYDCAKFVSIKKNGLVYYQDWDDYDKNNRNIKRIDIVPEDQYENIRFVEELHRACLKKNDC